MVSVYTHSTFQALQREAKSDVIKKMSLYSHENKTHFHKQGFALSLVLKSESFTNSEMAYLITYRDTLKTHLYMSVHNYRSQ